MNMPDMINFILYFVFCPAQSIQIVIKKFKEHSTFVLKFQVNIKIFHLEQKSVQFAINLSICQLRDSLLSWGGGGRDWRESHWYFLRSNFKVFILYGSLFLKKLSDGQKVVF